MLITWTYNMSTCLDLSKHWPPPESHSLRQFLLGLSLLLDWYIPCSTPFTSILIVDPLIMKVDLPLRSLANGFEQCSPPIIMVRFSLSFIHTHKNVVNLRRPPKATTITSNTKLHRNTVEDPISLILLVHLRSTLIGSRWQFSPPGTYNTNRKSCFLFFFLQ